MRNEAMCAVERRPSTLYVEPLVSDYKHKENCWTAADQVFPRTTSMLSGYSRQPRSAAAPRVGLKEPSSGEIARG